VSYLATYLQDHYAGSTVGYELAKRTAGANRGSDFGPPLERLARDIGEDRDTLRRLMDDLGVGVDRLKAGAGWAGEKLGRLKLNGKLLGYSPLSRVLEVEFLVLGVTGKLALWLALAELAPRDSRLDAGELERLAARAEDQRARLEDLRRKASAVAFATES
jgi:hypothetical protein